MQHWNISLCLGYSQHIAFFSNNFLFFLIRSLTKTILQKIYANTSIFIISYFLHFIQISLVLFLVVVPSKFRISVYSYLALSNNLLYIFNSFKTMNTYCITEFNFTKPFISAFCFASFLFRIIIFI